MCVCVYVCIYLNAFNFQLLLFHPSNDVLEYQHDRVGALTKDIAARGIIMIGRESFQLHRYLDSRFIQYCVWIGDPRS
jgi:hypothetical protein